LSFSSYYLAACHLPVARSILRYVDDKNYLDLLQSAAQKSSDSTQFDHSLTVLKSTGRQARFRRLSNSKEAVVNKTKLQRFRGETQLFVMEVFNR